MLNTYEEMSLRLLPPRLSLRCDFLALRTWNLEVRLVLVTVRRTRTRQLLILHHRVAQGTVLQHVRTGPAQCMLRHGAPALCTLVQHP